MCTAGYDIYVATCRICNQQYVSQTVKTFSKRWSSALEIDWYSGQYLGVTDISVSA